MEYNIPGPGEQFHDVQRFSPNDMFFIVGGNPDGDGGGVIGTAIMFRSATILRDEAIKRGYTGVQIQTWEEMMNGRMK